MLTKNFCVIILLADPDLLDKVEGLSPDKEKHQFFLDFYQVFFDKLNFSTKFKTLNHWIIFQLAGAPLSAEVRAQINFEVVPIEQIPFMKDLQPMYLPLLWFEDCMNLDKKLINMLKYQLIL